MPGPCTVLGCAVVPASTVATEAVQFIIITMTLLDLSCALSIDRGMSYIVVVEVQA